MKHEDPTPDGQVARALREFDRASGASPEDLQHLTERIVVSAVSLLDRRGNPAAQWWEYAAAWGRTLLEVGAATAVVAAACILWISHSRADAAATRVVAAPRTHTETPAMISQQLLYSLVAPVEQQVMPAARREQH